METTERRRGARYMEGYLEIKESAKVICIARLLQMLKYRKSSPARKSFSSNQCASLLQRSTRRVHFIRTQRQGKVEILSL